MHFPTPRAGNPLTKNETDEEAEEDPLQKKKKMAVGQQGLEKAKGEDGKDGKDGEDGGRMREG